MYVRIYVFHANNVICLDILIVNLFGCNFTTDPLWMMRKIRKTLHMLLMMVSCYNIHCVYVDIFVRELLSFNEVISKSVISLLTILIPVFT